MPTIYTEDGMREALEDIARAHEGVKTGGVLNEVVLKQKKDTAAKERARHQRLVDEYNQQQLDTAPVIESRTRGVTEVGLGYYLKGIALIFAGIFLFNLVRDIWAALPF